MIIACRVLSTLSRALQVSGPDPGRTQFHCIPTGREHPFGPLPRTALRLSWAIFLRSLRDADSIGYRNLAAGQAEGVFPAASG